MIKEVDKLRGSIQTLTRATNPLGKLLDYLQVSLFDEKIEIFVNLIFHFLGRRRNDAERITRVAEPV